MADIVSRLACMKILQILMFGSLCSICVSSKAVCTPYQAFVPEDTEAIEVLSGQGFGSVDIIYSNVIDPDGDSIVNSDMLTQYLFENHPFGDLVVLDWEGTTFKKLKEDVMPGSEKSAVQNRILSQYISAVNSLSAHIDVSSGYYDVPPKNLADKEEPMYTGLAIQKLQSEVDAFFPSGYLSQRRNTRSNEGVVLKYLKHALTEACLLDVEAYAFVNHRWHKRSGRHPLELIPIKRFSNFIRDVSTMSSGNCKYSGIIWWSADFRLNARGNKTVAHEMEKYSNGYSEFLEKELSKYSNVLTQHCK